MIPTNPRGEWEKKLRRKNSKAKNELEGLYDAYWEQPPVQVESPKITFWDEME